MMQNRRFALVAYLRSPAGQFIERLQQELHPGSPDFAAHLTILPPRVLQDCQTLALETLQEVCTHIEPFDVTLAGVETFIPLTPTLYIRIGSGAGRVRELHDQLNQRQLAAVEQWPYIPHVTIAKMTGEPEAQQAFLLARERWAQFDGSHTVALTEVTFVREEEPNCWVDLSSIPLGRSLVKS